MYNFMPMSSTQMEEESNSCFMDKLKKNMQDFWSERLSEICDSPSDVRSQQALPFTRIKKVMKSDEQVKMISGDTPVVFGKACEMFIMELTLRAWMHTVENKRRTLQRNDVANAVRDDALFLFLNDIVPMESHLHQEALPNHQEVYGPLSTRGTLATPPNNPMNVQSVNNRPSFFTRIQEMHEEL